MAKYLIAFMGKPRVGFITTLVRAAASEGVHIQGAVGRPGPGCYNLGLLMPENELFINCLTLVLMPAKWTTTEDHIEPGVFVME